MGVADSVFQHEMDAGGGDWERSSSDIAKRLKSPADPVPPFRSRDSNGATALSSRLLWLLWFGSSVPWLEGGCVGAFPNVMVFHQNSSFLWSFFLDIRTRSIPLEKSWINVVMVLSDQEVFFPNALPVRVL